MPFLPPNQQRQSTAGTDKACRYWQLTLICQNIFYLAYTMVQCGGVSTILRSAVLLELRLVTDRQTDRHRQTRHNSIYRAIRAAKWMCYTNICCGVLRVLTDGCSSRFPLWRHQLRASAARRAAWRGAVEASGSCGVRAWYAVDLTSIFDRRQLL